MAVAGAVPCSTNCGGLRHPIYFDIYLGLALRSAIFDALHVALFADDLSLSASVTVGPGVFALEAAVALNSVCDGAGFEG